MKKRGRPTKLNAGAMRPLPATESLEEAQAGAKFPVTMRILLQRINRKLKAADYQLCKAKGGWDSALGPYYAINMADHDIAEQNVDPEMMARELGVLRFWEKVVPAILVFALLAFTIRQVA